MNDPRRLLLHGHQPLHHVVPVYIRRCFQTWAQSAGVFLDDWREPHDVAGPGAFLTFRPPVIHGSQPRGERGVAAERADALVLIRAALPRSRL